MFIRARSPILALLVIGLGGCAALQSERRTVRTEGGIWNEAGATVISGSALDEASGSVLNAMRGRVPGMRILGNLDGCPQISLRNHATLNAVVNPLVYVEGTRTVGTCLLGTLRTEDVEAIEIYPMGVSRRPGYATHSNGLILVFMRGANG